MATDLTVILDDRAGQLAHMGEALGDAGVAIEGISATTSDGVGIVHVLVDNAMVAQNALILADIKVEGEADAVVIDLTAEEAGRPGTLGRLAGKVGTAGINVSVAYLATRDRVALVTNDNDRAREVLQA
ncbi:MAG TPA: amino acid-binding protein [Actinomycetota bacterium]|jgi:hypothetical protein